MRLQDALSKPGSRKRRRRIGRGIAAGQGASCGKGMRGQNSRSGRGTRPGFEGGQIPLYRRIPKLSRFHNPVSREKKKSKTEINVGKLSSLPPNTEVTLSSLIDVGIVTKDDGPLKVLGSGELSVPLVVKASAFTAQARNKIEKVGGICETTTYDDNIDLNLDWVDGCYKEFTERIELIRQILSTIDEVPVDELVKSPKAESMRRDMSRHRPFTESRLIEQIISSHHSFSSIERNTNIVFPPKCSINKEIELLVNLTLNVPSSIGSLQEKLASLGLNIEQVKLDVYITAQNFKLLEQLKSLSLYINESNKQIAFNLVPTKLGQQIIQVQFFNNASRVGYALVETYVEE